MIMAINKRIRNNKGFTLIELIVVLAVLGILAAIAVPRLTGVKADAAKKADAASKDIIRKAAELYIVSDDDFTLPTVSKKIPIDDLVSNGYLDSTPVVQSEESKKFQVQVDSDGVVTVVTVTKE